jgi:hypothetical protein
MSIKMMSSAAILGAVRRGENLHAALRCDDVLPLLFEATGRQYALSARKQKRAIRAKAPNAVRIVVTWLWDFAYIHVIPAIAGSDKRLYPQRKAA